MNMKIFLILVIASLLEWKLGTAQKRENPQRISESNSNVKTLRSPSFYSRRSSTSPEGFKVTHRSSPAFRDDASHLRSGYHSSSDSSNNTVIECEFPFREVGGSCYYATCPSGVTSQTWDEARAFCNTEYTGSDLAVFEDANQYSNALHYIQRTDVDMACSYWIGATDIDENGVFEWLDNTTVPSGIPYWGFEGGDQEPSDDDNQFYALLDSNDFYWIHNEDIGGDGSTDTVALCEIPPTVTTTRGYGSDSGDGDGSGTGGDGGDGGDGGSSTNVNVEGSSFSSTNDHSFTSDPVLVSNTTHITNQSAPINITIHYPKIVYLKSPPAPHYGPKPHPAPPKLTYNPQPHYQPQPTYQLQPYKPPTHHQQPYKPPTHHQQPYQPHPAPHYGTSNTHSGGYNHPHSHHHHHRSNQAEIALKGYTVPALKRIVNNLSELVGKQDIEVDGKGSPNKKTANISHKTMTAPAAADISY